MIIALIVERLLLPGCRDALVENDLGLILNDDVQFRLDLFEHKCVQNEVEVIGAAVAGIIVEVDRRVLVAVLPGITLAL